MSRDNNSKGIVLILIAMSLFAIQDSLIKFIFEKLRSDNPRLTVLSTWASESFKEMVKKSFN